MRKNNINLHILFIMLLSIVMINTNAQTGLNFQGVARTNNNVIIASQAITIKLSILQGSSTGTADYVETRRVITNAQGLFTAVIGDTGAISTLGNFNTINWKLSPKFLKIEMDPAAGNNFITMGTTQFQYVAYAQFAKSVDAENIVGILPVSKGGTGLSSNAALKSALSLDKINNTADADKPISTKTQTALDLIAVTATDTTRFLKRINSKADTADVSAITTTLGTKLNAADTIKYTKQAYLDSSLLTKLKIADTSAMLSSRIKRDTLNLSNRINSKADTADVSTITTTLGTKLNTADTIKYTKQAYSDSSLLTKLKISDTSAMLSSRIARDTLSLSNRINLKGNAADLTSGLALKENATNKSTASDLGGVSPSDVLFPTQKAVKDYVSANAGSGGVADAGITNIKLADGAVTYAKFQNIPTNSILGNTSSTTTSVQAIATTGSDNVVLSTSPTISSPILITPNLGAATASSINSVTINGFNFKGNVPSLNITGTTTLQGNNTGDNATNTKYEGLLTYGAVDLINDQAIDGKKTFLNNITMANLLGVGSITPTTINFANGSQIGDIQNLLGGYPDAAGSIDLYAPNGAKWVQMNYNNTNYIALGQNKASIELGNKYWGFNKDGSTVLPGKLELAGTLKLGTILFPNVSGALGDVLTADASGNAIWKAPAASDNIDASTLSGTTLKSTITGSSLTSVGTLANLTVINSIVGSVTGNAATATSAITAATAGTASTATKLATARNINGVAFDGSEDITITASTDAGTLTGTILNSTITGSSLTSVGTLSNLTVSNTIVGSITGNAETVTTNANLTGVVTSVGNITSIASGTISNSMLANTAVANLSGVNTGDNAVNSRYNSLAADISNLDNTLNAKINSKVTNAAHYGDIKAMITGSDAYYVIGINGTLLKYLETGILKNTTGTGVPSIAVASDFPTLNQSTTGNSATTTKLATSININGVAFDGTGDITIAANAGTLTGTSLNSTVVSSSLTSVGSLSNLTVTNTINGSVNGNAASATKLATTRNINGVAFDGTNNITITADAGTLTGTSLKSTVTSSSLTSVGTLANLTVTNPISGSITGNAATATLSSNATKLATSRNINGIAFDGTENITVATSAATLTGTTLNATVTSSSLTSVGVLNNATVNGKVIVGASSEASSTAILEASSTTQGFLPPRMTIVQRIAIVSPAQGLMIYCTNCGSYGEPQYYNGNAWMNFAGTASSKSTPTINITVSTYTFTTSTPQGPNSATNTGTGTTYTYTYLGTGSTTYASSATRPTNAGTYSVTASLSASGDDNYNAATASAAFTIALAIPTVTPTIGTYAYSGVAQGPSAATNTGTGSTYTYSYTGTGITTYGPSAIKPTDGGTYTVIATVAANGNYTSASSSATAFRITLSLAVGNTYGGGKVAYILKAGDIGYDANQQHGIIVSGYLTTDVIVWGNKLEETGASGGAAIYNEDHGTWYYPPADLETGMTNTNLIINSEGAGANYAASIARAYTGGGYTNWYLPSASQVNAMKANLSPSGVNYVWTSTEKSYGEAFVWTPINGYEPYQEKNNPIAKFLAARSF